MGNKQAKKTNAMIDQENTRLQGENTAFNANYAPKADEAYKFGQGARDETYAGYKNLTDPNFWSKMGIGSGHTAATTQAAKLSLDPRYQQLESKYFDPLAGSILDAQKGYNEFAQTGGYSDQDIGNIRARGNAPISSMFENLRNNLSQKQNAAGLNAGSLYGAASDRMNRQAAQSMGKQSLDTELGIKDKVNAGRQWGIGGQAELGGMGISGLGQVAGESQRINDFNEQQRVQAANANAASAASASNANWEDKLRAYGMGLGGMMDVWGMSGQPTGYDELMMQNRGMVGNQIGNNIQQRANYNPNVSWWDKAMQGIGAGAGLIGAF